LTGSKNAEVYNPDWWLAPADGAPAASSGAAAAMQRSKLAARYATPAAWTGSDWILFSVGSVDNANLHRMRIGGNGKFSEDPERITFGAGFETKPAVSATGQLALAGESISSHLWALPMDTNQGKPSGEMVQLTREATLDITPRVSQDGKKVVYFSVVANQSRLFARDLAGGNPRQLAPNFRFGSWISLIHGSKVLFSGRKGDDESVYSVDINGGIPAIVAPKSTLWGASADGRYLLTFGRDLLNYAAFDTETGTAHTLASHPNQQLLSPAFSPDGKWVAMHVRTSEMTRQIFVLPFHPDRETPQSEWIPITDGKRLDRDPKWSPDGNLLYFLADRDGVRGFHAQRLDPATKRSSGPEFEVKMFRSARRSMMYFPNSGFSGPAVTSDKIVFALGEMTGNIWLTKAPI
jgi:dipeptidyl aminopeptidase/acylaminoacyl peptidase